MTTSNITRFASITAVVFAAFMAVTSSVSEAAMLESIDGSHSVATTLQKDTNGAVEPQSIALLVMGLLGLVAVRRMQKA